MLGNEISSNNGAQDFQRRPSSDINVVSNLAQAFTDVMLWLRMAVCRVKLFVPFIETKFGLGQITPSAIFG